MIRHAAAALAAILVTAPAPAFAQARNFFEPSYLGQPVAFCLADQTRCGKAAADNWCQLNGFAEALSFQRRQALPADLTLRFADTGDTCTAGQCIGFRQIKCWNAG